MYNFILATAILDFWRMSTSRDTGSGTVKRLTRKHGDSCWNFVAMCSRTRDMPGGKIPLPSCCRQTSPKNCCRDKG